MRGEAARLGFDVCRIAAPDALADAPAALDAFVAEGRHGDMDWLAERRDWRGDPRKLWPQARSIVLLGMNYGPEGDALAGLTARSAGNISVYARNRDYHDVVKGKLKLLAAALLARAKNFGEEGAVKVFVDTAPVMEKPLAYAAGIGWQGKHTNLVSRDFGSWLFLGSIFTTLDLPPDAPESDHCGNCRACLDACPTGALDAPYRIDARLCVSYLTIEAKGQIPRDLREKIGNRIYGCDDCLAVCPWNKFAAEAHEAKLRARADLVAPPLAELAAMDEARFRVFFAGSPVKRIGHARFLRNVLVAIGNSGDSRLAPLARARLDHISPLARGMAVWALARLLPKTQFNQLAEQERARESDETVRLEWDAATKGREGA
ncbi:tRNA epoxyqueuosine(34) reductase QueG [Rhodoblastus acidophilus]|uniref:tRNA epoxyqueuosine(34) reductase QueG n=1 Tax=Candidatus Rhodoblastus alkanivorans TaxID=2954117 RepID=A0ABS9Z0P5_9HYPH|nr:tRNA epoxyqueuosine(34) reductase QueG [Candidatus Rhodoblastus alkanivorans]MCI4680478.1 tRNA epoxyqueuosine(34) reductase QueG [Candidatus Rhodoblastus alkanivorans]MCI4681178.1 tRNA epoxyqueuosine(34) reductase QueG [Candidatus Rhodoblastus alkanivorans]MDI4642221.1 tRNA epoxyqueuosine(34) reductase QueG [Rhodoblastus acidophilus]